MEFTPFTLPEHLTGEVEAIFHFRGFRPDHSIERVVPTGHVFVLFELDGITRHTYGEDLEPDADFTRAWVSGVRREHLAISAHADSEMLGIQFRHGGARPYLHLSMSELAQRVVPAELLFGDAVLALREELLAGSPADKFARVQTWLEGRRDPELGMPAALRELMGTLQQSHPAAYPEHFEAYPSTQKHLIDLFKLHVGLTPKAYQRIMRFNEILRRIHAGERLPWAQLALECGYADQSHFIREFRRFSGFRPGQFEAAGYDEQEPNFFPLDREPG